MASMDTKNQSNLQNFGKIWNCTPNLRIYINYAEITGKNAKKLQSDILFVKKVIKVWNISSEGNS